jgi:hypothetical protein
LSQQCDCQSHVPVVLYRMPHGPDELGLLWLPRLILEAGLRQNNGIKYYYFLLSSYPCEPP